MTTIPEREPTLTDVLNKLNTLSDEVNALSEDVKKFDERFSNY